MAAAYLRATTARRSWSRSTPARGRRDSTSTSRTSTGGRWCRWSPTAGGGRRPTRRGRRRPRLDRPACPRRPPAARPGSPGGPARAGPPEWGGPSQERQADPAIPGVSSGDVSDLPFELEARWSRVSGPLPTSRGSSSALSMRSGRSPAATSPSWTSRMAPPRPPGGRRDLGRPAAAHEPARPRRPRREPRRPRHPVVGVPRRGDADLREADRRLRPEGRLLVVHDYGRDDVSALRDPQSPEYRVWSRREGRSSPTRSSRSGSSTASGRSPRWTRPGRSLSTRSARGARPSGRA